MQTIEDVRTWLTRLEQSVEDRRFLDQLKRMQVVTRNVERDLRKLRRERNELIAEIDELRREVASLRELLDAQAASSR